MTFFLRHFCCCCFVGMEGQ